MSYLGANTKIGNVNVTSNFGMFTKMNLLDVGGPLEVLGGNRINESYSTKFRQLTGWAPEIPFEQSMSDLLNYWRIRVKATEAQSVVS